MAFRRVRQNPETKSIPTVAGTVLLTGTLFYWQVEDWSILDSLYFSVTTLTTLGLGDLHPTGDGSRIFTMVYLLIGIGVLVAFVTALGHQLVAIEDEKKREPAGH